MRKDDLYIAVPTFFRCPISLDVMKSPVSLCTGVTYDRASIHGGSTAEITLVQRRCRFSTTKISHLTGLFSVSSRFGLTLFTAELALNQLLRRGTRSPTRSIERFSNLILKPGRKRLTVIVSLFQTGNVELKIDCAGLLEFITVDGESKLLIAERDGLVTELTKSMNGDSDPRLIEASLSFLIAISSPKRVKLDLIREKVITNLTKLLTDDATAFSVTEKCLKLLESLASTKEGRLVIYGGDGECLKTVVKKADESIDGGDGACRDGCLERLLSFYGREGA
ncbi:hypothetical protein YC2023_113810 [Brassica napus]